MPQHRGHQAPRQFALFDRGEAGADVEPAVTALAVSRIEVKLLVCLAGISPYSPDELTAGHAIIVAPLGAIYNGDESGGRFANRPYETPNAWGGAGTCPVALAACSLGFRPTATLASPSCHSESIEESRTLDLRPPDEPRSARAWIPAQGRNDR